MHQRSFSHELRNAIGLELNAFRKSLLAFEACLCQRLVRKGAQDTQSKDRVDLEICESDSIISFFREKIELDLKLAAINVLCMVLQDIQSQVVVFEQHPGRQHIVRLLFLLHVLYTVFKRQSRRLIHLPITYVFPPPVISSR
jgi:hypothetical protein